MSSIVATVSGEGAIAEATDLEGQLKASSKRAHEADRPERTPCTTLPTAKRPRPLAVAPTLLVIAPALVLVYKAHQVVAHHLRVQLGTTGAFDGTGSLTGVNAADLRCSCAALGWAAWQLPINNIQGADLSGGIDLDVMALQPSAAMDDVALTLTLAGGTVPLSATTAQGTLTCVELTLDLCACRDDAVRPPAALSVTAKINPGRTLHLQRASRCAGRARLIVQQAQPAGYAGNLVLRPGNGQVALYDQEVAAGGQAAVVTPVTLANNALAGGQEYWVEGAAASAGLRDTGFTLELEALANQEGDRVQVTVVNVGLDICESRSDAAPLADPALLGAVAKLDPGRFVQLRNAGGHHGRAKLTVSRPVPNIFAGNLVLEALNNRVEAFDQEAPGGTRQAAYGQPLAIAAGTTPLVLWAEGAAVSGGLRDTGFLLRLADATDGRHVRNEGDRVAITVAELTQVEATIHPTPPLTNRGGAFPAPADHVVTSTELDDDFTANPPLVLMRNAQPDIALVATAAPAGLPLRWQAIRNPQDDATLGNAAALPTLAIPDPGHPERAVLSADNRGSFRIRAYLDCNGNGVYDAREPSSPLNLVLADATVHADNSAAVNTNLAATYYAQDDVFSIDNGEWPNGAWAGCLAGNGTGAGMTMELLADVTGGGADGRLGLDQVFGGLVNVLLADNTQGVYRDTTGLAPVDYTVDTVFVSNRNTAGGMYDDLHMFQPGGTAPAVWGFPLLDTGRAPAGIGGDTATMGRSGMWDAAVNLQVGSRYTLRCIDSPGRGFPRIHPDHVGALLRRILYDVRFQANFCFWTNVNRSRGTTGHAAERVYCVLRIVSWRALGAWTVNAHAGTLANTTPHAITITQQTTVTPLERARDRAVEVRPPNTLPYAAAVTT